MSDTVVIVGASVEGLVAAARLAGSGKRVTVLESLGDPGGLCASGPIGQHHRHMGSWPVVDSLSDSVVQALQLERHGLVLGDIPPVLAVGADRAVWATHDGANTVGDGDGWKQHHAFLDAVLPLARTWLSAPAPRIGVNDPIIPLAKRALALRRLGSPTMMELLRVGPSCVDDFLAESFSDPLLRAALALPALHGSWMGPRSPQSTALYLMRAALHTRSVVGGPASLVQALVACCASRGVEIQCGASVQALTAQDGRISGVTLQDGTHVPAHTVVSTIGPVETLGRLLPAKERHPAEAYTADRIRTRGTWGAVHIAMQGALRFNAAKDEAVDRAVVADGPLDIERSFDDVKYRRLPTRPVLDVSVRAGASGTTSIVSVQTLVGHEQDQGWTPNTEKAFTMAVLERLAAVSDLTSDRIHAARVITPAECATTWGHEGGHPLHGELALDQLWALRPARTLAQHRTATPGLWLASTGTAPGVVGTGLSGLHTADAIIG